ncbi:MULTISPECIES: hypothetical protein [unclassified Leptospira]|uniref:hypothetical protein n=1 Tax=unclassified Leptospira TaxID=2633828 RepID=UPI0002BF8AB7|nr:MULTISPECIES: hypothetical protein [unclassified Leptospira]EMJ97432.1 hypothetical protein LEP1GSC192_3418 [Leptospira sp. B5-022]MCR1792763.1 hypothetical protein [Leptospira sp. id769339]
MLSCRILFGSILYKFIILMFVMPILNCGLALGYQAEEQAAKVSENNNNDSMLAALGLLSGNSSSLLSFSPSPLTFSASTGKSAYDITVNYWPGSGTGELRIDLVWNGIMSCAPQEGVFAVFNDDTYPLTFANVSFDCFITGIGEVSHIVDMAIGSGLPSVGTNLGNLSVTVTP